MGEFPGGPVVRIPRLHCKGHRFDTQLGKLRCCIPWGAAKKKKKNRVFVNKKFFFK